MRGGAEIGIAALGEIARARKGWIVDREENRAAVVFLPDLLQRVNEPVELRRLIAFGIVELAPIDVVGIKANKIGERRPEDPIRIALDHRFALATAQIIIRNMPVVFTKIHHEMIDGGFSVFVFHFSVVIAGYGENLPGVIFVGGIELIVKELFACPLGAGFFLSGLL